MASMSSSLSAFSPLKTTICAPQAVVQLAVELLGLVACPSATLFHGRRHHHAGGVQAAGGKCLVDVDLGDLFGELVGQLGQLGGQSAMSAGLAFQSTRSMSYFRVFCSMITLPGGRLRRSPLADLVLDGDGRRIEPIVDEGDFGSRGFRPAGRGPWRATFRLAADVAEDDLLPALLPAVTRGFPSSSAGGCRPRRPWLPAWRPRRRGPARACRWARRPGQSSRGMAARYFSSGRVAAVGIVAQESAAPGREFFSSDGHDSLPSEWILELEMVARAGTSG